jgi:hypothetical protein
LSAIDGQKTAENDDGHWFLNLAAMIIAAHRKWQNVKPGHNRGHKDGNEPIARAFDGGLKLPLHPQRPYLP